MTTGAKRLAQGAERPIRMGRNVSHAGSKCLNLEKGRKVFRIQGGETSSQGAKRLQLGQVVTVTGAKHLEDGCETSWEAKRLWCEMS